jgi:hypothetical protein
MIVEEWKDEDPYCFCPKYECSIEIGEKQHRITSISDFCILHEDKMFLVIEDKTIINANYGNSWKEPQVLGELFVSAHKLATGKKKLDKTPIQTFALRVVGTMFTFYKAIVNIDYIKAF